MLVHNKGNYVRNYQGVRLIPGANNIDKRDWEKFISHPLNELLVEKGELIPIELDGEERSISNMNVAEAVSLIKDTYSLDLLTNYEVDETGSAKPRKSVLDAITKQKEDITKSLDEGRKKAEGDE